MSRSLALLVLAGCSSSGLHQQLEQGEADGDRAQACTGIQRGDEGERAEWGTRLTAERPSCSTVEHAVEGPSGAVLEVTLEGWSGPATLQQQDWNGYVLEQVDGLVAGDSVRITVPFAGEHLLVLSPEASSADSSSYALTVTCVEGCAEPYARYPFFFMHGMGAPIPGATEFVEVESLFHDNGYVAWAPVVTGWNDSDNRAQQWREHLDQWRASGTWRKVHLIGHSMGGVDARNLAAHLDPHGQVATVTSVATPHLGAIGADIMVGATSVGVLDWVLDEATDVLSSWVAAPGEQNFAEQMANLSTDGMHEFNLVTPDRSDVYYRSWAGVTCNWIDWGCRDLLHGEVVDFSMEATLLITDLYGLPNDGLVDIDSARWGDFQGVLPADHLDLNGRLETDGPFDHYEFYLREARRLAAWERGEQGEPEPILIDPEVFSD